MALEAWALPRLQQLLPLDDESLTEVLRYAAGLPKDAAANHLKDLLGDNPPALDFISAFNHRRPTPPAASLPSAVAAAANPTLPASYGGRQSAPPSDGPRPGTRGGRGGKRRANIHALPARQIQNRGDVGAAYRKRDEEDYFPPHTHKERLADNLALRERRPDATQMPLITDSSGPAAGPAPSKAPPSASGPLISDALAPRKVTSAHSSRTSSPAPKTKITIAGGTAMHGASTALSDLDSAIKALEIQTNPALALTETENERRRCNCMATRHPLLDIAPNCLHCGQIICVKQGLGPCTFCGTPLLGADDVHQVLRVLKDERGEARMNAHNAPHKRPDVALGKPRAFTGRDFLASHAAQPSPLASSTPNATAAPSSSDEAATKAKAHRDKLLTYQANNARRTQVHDEAADYDIPASGTNMWASPTERAQQLKKQQRVLREMEWAARPEYEKRRVVASIDLKGGKVVRRMAEVERPDFSTGTPDEEAEGRNDDQTSSLPDRGREQRGAGAFSRNPLAAGLIRPRAKEDKGKGAEAPREKASTWRRVQMDADQGDNEAWILDGGVYGGRDVPADQRVLGAEEHAFG